jgi:hypothetical protein
METGVKKYVDKGELFLRDIRETSMVLLYSLNLEISKKAEIKSYILGIGYYRPVDNNCYLQHQL